MPTDILMPALSPTMEKGNLVKWLKKEGESVKSGDILAEIETDKATMEVEAADEGVLARIVVPEGTADVPVNTPIAVLAGEGEEVGDVPAPEKAPEPPARPMPAEAASKPTDDVAPGPQANGHLSYARVDDAPQGPAVPDRAAAGEEGAPNGAGGARRLFASPLARRTAQQAGLDLGRIKGSGPHGRIIARDLAAALKAGAGRGAPAAEPKPQARAPEGAPRPAAAPQAPPPAAPSGLTAAQVKGLFEPGSFEEVPLDGMRKTVARRLTESKQNVPHFYLTVDVALDALLALREQLNADVPPGADGRPAFKLSVNDFVIKALALALQRVPDANVVWAEDRILKFRHSDVGVAVAVEGGLFTPVIRKAEAKTLSAISNEMKDLAARARARRLKPQEYQGGAAAISNLGMFGIREFAAVINPPHATILAVGAGEKRVVVVGDAPKVATMMTVTLSTDHRAVDGALGARLLGAFKELIEAPVRMLV